MTISAPTEIPSFKSEEISVVDSSALLPGDIILSTAAGWESWLIRSATLSKVSHAALHVEHGIAIEANDPGVVQVYLPVVGYEKRQSLCECLISRWNIVAESLPMLWASCTALTPRCCSDKAEVPPAKRRSGALLFAARCFGLRKHRSPNMLIGRILYARSYHGL
jgi:hypothetical protein